MAHLHLGTDVIARDQLVFKEVTQAALADPASGRNLLQATSIETCQRFIHLAGRFDHFLCDLAFAGLQFLLPQVVTYQLDMHRLYVLYSTTQDTSQALGCRSLEGHLPCQGGFNDHVHSLSSCKEASRNRERSCPG